MQTVLSEENWETGEKISEKKYFESIQSRETKTCSIFAKYGHFSNVDSELCLQTTRLTKRWVNICRIWAYFSEGMT